VPAEAEPAGLGGVETAELSLGVQGEGVKAGPASEARAMEAIVHGYLGPAEQVRVGMKCGALLLRLAAAIGV
jgi:hypothetical protein